MTCKESHSRTSREKPKVLQKSTTCSKPRASAKKGERRPFQQAWRVSLALPLQSWTMIPMPIFPRVKLQAASQFTLYTYTGGLHQLTEPDRVEEWELMAWWGKEFAYLYNHKSFLTFAKKTVRVNKFLFMNKLSLLSQINLVVTTTSSSSSVVNLLVNKFHISRMEGLSQIKFCSLIQL